MKKEFVVGVTGASGVVYARRLLEVLCDQATVHIVISDTARQIAGIERVDLTGFDAIYAENSNLAADIASGSFRYDGMAIVPCSMKTLAAVSNGLADNLIARAADVCL
ncbi:MAG: UbiX family flavin prenyltransferase, partial [Methanoculleus sp.]|nr:UbiX family flavin prenyltransferase [Methanoculleus sp.]